MRRCHGQILYFAAACFLFIFIAGIHGSRAREFISPHRAIDHAGEYGTVCGTVESARHASRSKGGPTFLNLDEPYPDQVFTALIWGEDRDKFEEPPEEFFKGKEICVEGVISIFRKKAQIVVSEPSQITLREGKSG